jgi:hypothetical protein
MLAGTATAQDSPSLGDLARQQRQQKEHSKPAPGKDAKAPKVITNEEIPEHAAPVRVLANSEEHGDSMPAGSGAKQPAEHWQSQIQSQKSQIASLQTEIDQINESVRFAPSNCVGRCVEWNQRQREKQEQVERMQGQLQEQKKHLEEMQDAARKQGYGSSVYDP